VQQHGSPYSNTLSQWTLFPARRSSSAQQNPPPDTRRDSSRAPNDSLPSIDHHGFGEVLPTELLHRVFLEGYTEGHSYRWIIRTARLVCRRWKGAVDSMPILWNESVFDSSMVNENRLQCISGECFAVMNPMIFKSIKVNFLRTFGNKE
jgi:hypothetical protein